MTALDPGNIRTRGPEEFYESSLFELPADARVTTIRWESNTPPKT